MLERLRAAPCRGANLEDKPEKVMAILKQEGAQIFITGTSNAAAGDTHRGPGEVTLYTYEAECNLRGYLEDTGQLIFKIPGKPTRGVARVARSAWLRVALCACNCLVRVSISVLRVCNC